VTITKCARTVCTKTSAAPKEDGWTWVEFDPELLKTGGCCPACMEGLRRILTEQNIEPDVEPLH
jgi:hypothetical protein